MHPSKPSKSEHVSISEQPLWEDFYPDLSFLDTVFITVSISRFIFDIIDVAIMTNSLAFRFLFSTLEIIPPLTIDGVKKL